MSATDDRAFLDVDDEPTSAWDGPRAGFVSRYQLCFELAKGGMATIYLARLARAGPEGLDKLVALKLIHPHLSDQAEFIAMFLDEARVVSGINHPNVCAVYDYGCSDGTYYLAMEYLLGETLSRLSRAVSRSPRMMASHRWTLLASRIIADAGEGLHAAHELRGEDGELMHVVHRDVTPQNLFVNYDGTVRVVDFGIVRAHGRLHQTVVGTIKGKYAYMSPEQLRQLDVDRRADVWSLGVVLWELLTSTRLFRRPSDVETMFAVAEEPILPPSAVRGAVPPELDAIVLRALARDPDQRYASAREMSIDLKRFLAREHDRAGHEELAAWMDQLFEEDKARKMELVEVARVPTVTGATGFVPKAPLAPETSNSMTSTSSALAVEKRASVPPPPVTSSRRYLALSAIVLIIAGGAAVGILAEGALRRGETLLPRAMDGPATVVQSKTYTAPARQPDDRALAPVPVAPPPPIPGAGEPGSEATAAAEPAEHAERAERAERAEHTERARRAEHTEHAERAAHRQRAEERVADREERQVTGRRRRRPRGAGAGAGRGGQAARAPSGPPGVLNVATPGGWADIYMGARRLGRSPAQLTLPAGRHVLTLRPFGREPGRRATALVRSGATSRLAVPVSQ